MKNQNNFSTFVRIMNPKHDFSITEAYRYLSNAKETLYKSPIEYARFTDRKYVREAAGIAYLAALMAIDTYRVEKTKVKKPKSIDGYFDLIRKHVPLNGKLYAALDIVYDSLHVTAYYIGNTGITAIKEGFENVKKIIDMMSNLLQNSDYPGKVEEEAETYKTRRSSKEEVMSWE